MAEYNLPWKHLSKEVPIGNRIDTFDRMVWSISHAVWCMDTGCGFAHAFTWMQDALTLSLILADGEKTAWIVPGLGFAIRSEDDPTQFYYVKHDDCKKSKRRFYPIANPCL